VTDEATLGGYLAKHQRPPAFGGPDGRAYSVGVMLADGPDATGRVGGALLFVRWSPAGDAPDGHVETDYVVHGATREDARRALHALSLHDLKAHLDRAVEARAREPDW
jgi:hypothetical protein